MYSHGYDLEPAGTGGCQLLRHSGDYKLYPADRALLPNVALLHQRHLGREDSPARVWQDCHRRPHLPRHPARSRHCYPIRGHETPRKAEVREPVLAILRPSRPPWLGVYVSQYLGFTNEQHHPHLRRAGYTHSR